MFPSFGQGKDLKNKLEGMTLPQVGPRKQIGGDDGSRLLKHLLNF